MHDWFRCVSKALAFVAAVLVSHGCSNQSAQISTALTNTEPQFVITNRVDNGSPDTVVVYVHGIFGDVVETWRNSAKVGFFDLVDRSPEFKGRFDAYAFGYSSHYIANGSYRIREAAKRLRLHYDNYLRSYKRIIFVAHSMGGLVTMRFLIANPEVVRQVPVIVLYSTPQEPAQVAGIANAVLNNPSLYEMSDTKENQFFVDLNDDWKRLNKKPAVVCAYEMKAVGPVRVVAQLPATRYCDGDTPGIDADHISIVKPESSGNDSFLVLARALRAHTKTPPENLSVYTEAQQAEIKGSEARIQHNITRFPSEGIKDAKALVAKFPEHANGYRLVGLGYWNRGDFEPALQAYQDALKRDPEPEIRFKLQVNRVATLLALGRPSDAQPMLDTLVVDHGDDEVVRILVGLAKMRSQDFSGAATKFGELAGSTKLPGSLPFVKMALGLSLAQSSNTKDDRAADLLEDAVALEPRARAVFASTTEPVMIEGWNYAIFRDFYDTVRERAKLKKFVRLGSQAVQRKECS